MLSWNISDFTGANHQVIAVILVSLVSFIFSLSIKSKQMAGIQKKDVNSWIGLKLNLTPYG